MGTLSNAMGLKDLIRKECIELDVPAADKADLIRAMARKLGETGVVTDSEAVARSLLERERVMSTGIGGGVAIPHAQNPAVKTLAVSLVRPKDGIDFESLDEKPVRLIFMIVGPEERGGFIRILARISRLLYSGDLQVRLLEARSADEVIEVIGEEEGKLRG